MDPQAYLTGLLLVLVLTGAEDPMKCYTCNAKVGGLDPMNCVEPNENTTAAVCRPGENFCKKKMVKGPAETTVDRRCYDTCTEQNDIHMGFQVFIDVFCCQGALCNAAPPASTPLALGSLAMLMTFFTKCGLHGSGLGLSVFGALLIALLPTLYTQHLM